SVAPLGILMGPMLCGVYLCLFARMRGERIGFDLLFRGFEHFVPSLIATLIQMVPMMLVIVPGYVVMSVAIGVGIGLGSGRHGHAAVFPPLFASVLAMTLLVMLAA